LSRYPDSYKVRRILAVAVVMAVAALGQRTSAQQQSSFTLSLFERYLEALRVEAGIPGMSGAVLQDGITLWQRSFGYRDVENAVPPDVTTPYAIGGLSQIFGSSLLLRTCIEEDARNLTDRVTDWLPEYSDANATLVHLLAHVQTSGAYKYDLGGFSFLTPIVRACANAPYAHVLTERIFSQLAMVTAVPGTALATPTPQDVETFDATTLVHFGDVLRRMAVPYRVDIRGRATRTDLAATRADASTGVVASVADLATFDSALWPNDLVLRPATQQAAWIRPVPHLPMGLGWFVQNYNNEAVVWQFGVVPDAYSSLIVKLPNRRLTFILLANSDGLTAPFPLENGDVTASLFARTFLRLFVP